MSSSPRPRVVIIAPDGEDYERRLHALGGDAIPLTVCTSAAQAREQYAGQPVLFGIPDLIARLIGDWPAVEWVQSMWAGVRPLIDGQRHDYVLTGVKGVFGPLMAEYVAGYLLARELGVVQRWERQRGREWYERPSGGVQGKRAGIMGTGSIGRDIARMLTRLGLDVVGLNRLGEPADPFQRVYAIGKLSTFLRELDYLVAVLPDTPETRRLLDAKALACLPPHAVLVNVGRGNLVDATALCEALTHGRLAGAVLDVFDEEPLPQDSPLWNTPNLIVTGHVAAPSLPAEITPIFLDNYHRFCNGKPLRHAIDFKQGY